jgi:nitrite reductase/ring-hydroxylating ferredoxin subunit
MMQARDERLIAPASAADEPDMRLGGWSDLRSRLPLDVEFGGQPFQLAEIDGRPVVYSTVCPHQLGPLSAVDGDAGHLECPWHGYAFDALTGRSCDGHGLRLAVPPQVFVEPDTDQVWLRAPSAD